jgi:hypothetical protein
LKADLPQKRCLFKSMESRGRKGLAPWKLCDPPSFVLFRMLTQASLQTHFGCTPMLRRISKRESRRDRLVRLTTDDDAFASCGVAAGVHGLGVSLHHVRFARQPPPNADFGWTADIRCSRAVAINACRQTKENSRLHQESQREREREKERHDDDDDDEVQLKSAATSSACPSRGRHNLHAHCA